MSPDAIRKAQAALPATRAELAVKLGRSPKDVWAVPRYLIKHGYAEEWGSVMTEKGTLAPVLQSTGKEPPKWTA